jgi:tetratricopeptide (TPR) repeat protein
MRVLKMIEQLAGAADWRGVAAQERAGRAVAASVASFVYSTLGNVHCSQGGFSKAIEYPGDCKSGGGRPGGGLGCSYQSQGDYAKDIEYHVQHLEIAKEVGDQAGDGAANGNLGDAYQSQGDVSKAIDYLTQ